MPATPNKIHLAESEFVTTDAFVGIHTGDTPNIVSVQEPVDSSAAAIPQYTPLCRESATSRTLVPWTPASTTPIVAINTFPIPLLAEVKTAGVWREGSFNLDGINRSLMGTVTDDEILIGLGDGNIYLKRPIYSEGVNTVAPTL